MRAGGGQDSALPPEVTGDKRLAAAAPTHAARGILTIPHSRRSAARRPACPESLSARLPPPATPCGPFPGAAQLRRRVTPGRDYLTRYKSSYDTDPRGGRPGG